jgi:hypothetical protein
MYIEDRSVTDTINDLTANSCCELFGDYGLQLQQCQFDWGESDAQLFSSVMGFVSDKVRGTCLLACEEAPLDASCPPGGNRRDWVGELANQLIGRLKVKLLAYEINIALTTPIVLRGMRLQPLPRTTIAPTTFCCGNGRILAWIEVEVESGYSLPPPRSRAAAGETGELMLF